MKFFLTLALSALLSWFSAGAQLNSHYRLSVFGTRNGLLSPKIYSLIQSKDRQLWIGTEIGASRFNGYEFQNIQYTQSQEQVGKIVAITEDSLGGMWLGGEAGLFYFFGGQLQRCVFTGPYVPAIETLVTDKNGNVWIGEMHGLYRLSPDEIKQWRLKKPALHLTPYNGIAQRIICLDTDAEANIYFGSFDGVFLLKQGAADAKPLWKNTDPGNLVRFVTALSPDCLFFNQYNGESTSLINNVIKNYRAKDNVGHCFFKKDNTVFRLTTSTVERFADNNFVRLINYGQQTNFAFNAVCDAEGDIWLGTWEGLFKYRYSPFSIYHRKQTDHPETFSFLETKNGDLLFGGNRGQVHHKKDSLVVPSADFKPVFPLAEVLAMYQHDDGSFWFGSGYQGITRLRNGRYTNFNESNGLPDNHCNTFFRVDNRTVFACSEKGIIVLDPAAENPMKTHYEFEKAFNRQPKLSGVLKLVNDGFLFYGNQGLFRLRQGKLVEEKIVGLPAENLYITRMQRDERERIWVATQGMGLLQCRYSGESLKLEKHYTKKDGLPSDELLSLLVDKNDKLWVAGYTSLSLFDADNGQKGFINFTEQDGLPGDYYQHLHLAPQKDGTIWGLTSMSLFSFHPDSIILNNISPTVSFSALKLEKGEKKDLSLAVHPALSHDENSLSFSFTAVSLANPSKILYAYRLLPGDTAWIQTAERKIYFNSLNPGHYAVQVKASNNNNVWSDPIQYSFEIKPPFWNTWWFHALLVVALLGLVFFLFRRRIRTVKERAAIRQQLTELESKALRAQMNPHFIFNSLNAIQELIVTEDVEAAYNYLSKFSKLLRLVLNHSEQSLIPLADELVMLQLYLELESLRFRNSFSYEIVIDESLDAEAVFVPPLLLQPFIENAVWHGLMLKEGDKKLALSVRRENGSIVCIIQDNGIGRKKAAEIKAQKIGARHFESKGLKLSQARIQLLQQEGTHGTVQIEDLYENSLAAGTRISIQLPVVHK